MPFGGLFSAIGQGIKKVPGILGKLGGQDEDLPLTPGFNPDAPSPVFGQGRRPSIMGGQAVPMQRPAGEGSQINPNPPLTRPGAAPNVPGGVVPEIRPHTPTEQMSEARDVYMQAYKKPSGFGDRLKGGLMPAITGALKGLATTGDLGGAIGGAAGGFGSGVFAPHAVREQQFNEQIRPQITQRQQVDAEIAQQEAVRQEAELNRRYKEAQIGHMGSEDRRRTEQSQLDREKFDFERNRPLILSRGQIASDPTTRQQIAAGPEFERAPAWRQDENGRWIDLNNPDSAAPPVQGMIPRGRARSGGRRGSGRSSSGDYEGSPTAGMKQGGINALRADLEKFEKAKGDATIQTDPLMKEASLTEMRAKAQNIADLYGDAVEVGGLGPGQWPYVKMRSRQPQSQTARKSAGSQQSASRVSESDLQRYMKQFDVSREEAIADARADGLM